MEVFSAAVLGIVQGLTEFLPVSSSGHLIFLPDLFGWGGVVDSLQFDVALHVGTSLAVVWFFWGDWVRISKSFCTGLVHGEVTREFESRLLLMILVGSVPAAIVGLGFKDFIEENTREPLLVAATLFVFALVLLFADKRGAKRKEVKQISWTDAIVVGAAQARALMPGVSRSGITISAG
ncbi:undecaprenyl-diphosphate phosphatase, partial [Patescibacteria group bacterium]|nr:undecaprenyl-diphosphate phosphatase [Patescibacteria group bacterium]